MTATAVRPPMGSPGEYGIVRPPKPPPAVPPRFDPIDELLKQAAASGDRKLVEAAARTRALIDAIRRLFDDLEGRREAEEEVARAKAALQAAENKLRKVNGQPPLTPNDHGRSKRIRTWARGKGIEVKAYGQVGADVVAKYEADTGDRSGRRGRS